MLAQPGPQICCQLCDFSIRKSLPLQELQSQKEASDNAADEIAQRFGDIQEQHAEEIDQLQRQMRVDLCVSQIS